MFCAVESLLVLSLVQTPVACQCQRDHLERPCRSTLLLTDGTVMCHEYESPNWHKLVPDARGYYHVRYSTMAVTTGKAVHHTHFHVPHHVPPGHYELVVIANGIPSHPVKVHVKA
jgi:hypothetical protein